MREVYLDNNATTPVDEEVLEVMVEALRDNYGNPSSAHVRGARARQALERAREQVAVLLQASPSEIVFTGSGTEGNNAAILGALALRPDRRRIVMSSVEHPAVRGPIHHLGARGFDVREIPNLPDGSLDLAAARELITPETALVSVMAVNNETGVILPVAEVAELAAGVGALMHVDAVQAVSRVPLDLGSLPIDLLTISGHKLHAPKGIGALYVRSGIRIEPLLQGGHQERGQRGGTENVPAAVALGRACELFTGCDYSQVAGYRDILQSELLARVPDARVNGADLPRVANTLSIGFPGIEAESLVHALSSRGIYVSTGSACQSGMLEMSHVLMAMHVPAPCIQGTVRFSLSVYTTSREVKVAVESVPALVEELRALRPAQSDLAEPGEEAWPF